MSDADLQRWEDIVEREMLGEELTEADRDFRVAFEAEHPEQAHESEAWDGLLSSMREEAEAEGHARIDALAQRVLVQRDLERDVIRPLRAPQRGQRKTVAIVATLAAAAAVAFVVVERSSSQPDTVVAETEAPSPAPAPAAEPDPTPAPAPAPEPEPEQSGLLALAGEGLLVDGGMALAGSQVHPGQRLEFGTEVAEGAAACLVFDAPWLTACFSRASVLTVASDANAGERRLELERGRVLVTLDELPPGQRFSIVTSKGTIAAVGTTFEVWVDEQGTVRASVLEGSVQVEDGPRPRALQAGETTVLGADRIDRLGADALAWSRAHVQLSSIWQHGERGVVVVRSANEDRNSLTVDALPIGAAPVSLLAASGEHLLARAGSPRGVQIEVEPGDTHEITLEGEIEPRPKKRADKPTVKDLIRKADEARRTARYEDAAKHLERLLSLYPNSADAQNARVELGDLLRSKLGLPGRALQLYDAYLERGGNLTLEARFGRIRAFQALGQSANELRAIEAFLAKHPRDWRSSGLRERAAVLE